MQSQRNYNAVLHSAHLLLKSKPQAAEEFAYHLGKTANSVRNELNPNLPNHKLGVVDALEMMNVAGVYSLLYQMAAACGFAVVPVQYLNISDDSRLLDNFCKWQAAVGNTCQSIFEAIEDDMITPHELNNITKAGNQKMVQWFNVQHALEAEAKKHHAKRT
ncbi:phage regulatory CII family protein [Alteromonas sp. RKMC-009]|uniref:phage regulatory CII family protein n=1 Tax=Alteromonas sp. RKMC-009 TaxID=2267264 RepID=UPI000E6A0947|nr:phage regulatory CII family protein [Alteromonas sp. RKMC-009]AYA63844.1 hypothetical protein DS731_07420 [Alteromonas sp. RKMC-009]